jgi:hypothetical protein
MESGRYIGGRVFNVRPDRLAEHLSHGPRWR